MKHRVWCHLGVALLVAGTGLACSSDSPLPTSPTPAPGTAADAGPDGSTLKVTPPELLAPINNVRLQNQTPVFRFANGQGRFIDAAFDYQLQLLSSSGQVVYSVILKPGTGETTHTYPGFLQVNRPYTWRVRGVLQGGHGPWSATAAFRTAERPLLHPGNMFAFIVQFAKGHPDWNACVTGNGVACHRFTRAVARTANPTCDRRSWGILGKAPGEWQCTIAECGQLDGRGAGEDVITWGGSSPIGVYDIILGAGAPGAALTWQNISGTRRPWNQWYCPWN